MSLSPAISTEMSDSTVRRYLSLPYRIALTRDGADEDTPWRAEVEELPGCAVTGATPAEAAERVPSALAEWVAAALAEGRDIPEPRNARSYSGKLLLRMPLTLHAELAQAAEREQVSLNGYINGQLAAAIGWRRAPLAVPSQDQAAADNQSRGRLYLWALAINLLVVGFAALVALFVLLNAL
jgi:predicted RNase H-like HicB family nuclease